MRALVNYNITAITCKNAYDKTPFQVALMGKQKATAGFLLGKQWSRIQVRPGQVIVLYTYHMLYHCKKVYLLLVFNFLYTVSILIIMFVRVHVCLLLYASNKIVYVDLLLDSNGSKKTMIRAHSRI